MGKFCVVQITRQFTNSKFRFSVMEATLYLPLNLAKVYSNPTSQLNLRPVISNGRVSDKWTHILPYRLQSFICDDDVDIYTRWHFKRKRIMRKPSRVVSILFSSQNPFKRFPCPAAFSVRHAAAKIRYSYEYLLFTLK